MIVNTSKAFSLAVICLTTVKPCFLYVCQVLNTRFSQAHTHTLARAGAHAKTPNVTTFAA